MGALVVLVAVQLSVMGLYLPPVFRHRSRLLRPRRSSQCQSRLLCETVEAQARWSCWWPSKCRDRIVLPPVLNAKIVSAPDDHFTASPNGGVLKSGRRRVGSASSCPTIGVRIVSAAVFVARACVSRPRQSFQCRSRLRCEVAATRRVRWWWSQPTCLC